MVAFHDRRTVSLSGPQDVAPGLDMGPGVRLSRNVINDAFVTRSERTERGLTYSVHEALPDGRLIVRDSDLPTRYAARKSALGMTPSNIREL